MMAPRKDQQGEREKPRADERAPADPAHAGAKPTRRRLTDEEAHAELRRRQLKRGS